MQPLIDFLYHSPTAWHAVENLSISLDNQGFEYLDERKNWKLQPGKAYYTTRNGSSLIGFVLPKKTPSFVHICASHTDSPALKLKPNAAFRKENMLLIGTDIYGGPLLSSWLNRDLGIAGRVITLDKKGNPVEKLVRADHAPLVIPQLAIHLDREVNTKGLILNKQDHLSALASIECKSDKDAQNYLNQLLGIDPILSADLFLYPLDPPSYLSSNQELLASYRLDSLESVHAIAEALIIQSKPSNEGIKMCVFWDNEEIGSETAHGAASPFFSDTLERILHALNLSRQDYLRINSSSLCVSVDLAHALNPNYTDKHEPQHKVYLGGGIVIKHSAQNRYASDARTASVIKALCKKHKIPCQDVIGRADIASGSTIGPIHANSTGMPTVDIGCAQLSMHSTREIISMKDHESMIKLLSAFYKE